eukprot:gene8919-1599_t
MDIIGCVLRMTAVTAVIFVYCVPSGALWSEHFFPDLSLMLAVNAHLLVQAAACLVRSDTRSSSLHAVVHAVGAVIASGVYGAPLPSQGLPERWVGLTLIFVLGAASCASIALPSKLPSLVSTADSLFWIGAFLVHLGLGVSTAPAFLLPLVLLACQEGVLSSDEPDIREAGVEQQWQARLDATVAEWQHRLDDCKAHYENFVQDVTASQYPAPFMVTADASVKFWLQRNSESRRTKTTGAGALACHVFIFQKSAADQVQRERNSAAAQLQREREQCRQDKEAACTAVFEQQSCCVLPKELLSWTAEIEACKRELESCNSSLAGTHFGAATSDLIPQDSLAAAKTCAESELDHQRRQHKKEVETLHQNNDSIRHEMQAKHKAVLQEQETKHVEAFRQLASKAATTQSPLQDRLETATTAQEQLQERLQAAQTELQKDQEERLKLSEIMNQKEINLKVQDLQLELAQALDAQSELEDVVSTLQTKSEGLEVHAMASDRAAASVLLQVQEESARQRAYATQRTTRKDIHINQLTDALSVQQAAAAGLQGKLIEFESTVTCVRPGMPGLDSHEACNGAISDLRQAYDKLYYDFERCLEEVLILRSRTSRDSAEHGRLVQHLMQ